MATPIVQTKAMPLLLQEAKHHALKQGMMRLFTEASEIARPVFQRAGYSCLQRRDFTPKGVAIHNYAMAQSLR
ncbi:hypothetical protein D6851_14580 [Altericroceibacterium spongiae]|uniref:N-acetyltransferase domain-containing protein n=1 Tax=Altericroceibacterium spongiae TaxID=2320269 RepID=A0A420ECH7_9SPHN|nr:hypothetical protein [Altericroceibacterium spongiae]RKF18363.1 hypothetical protein D6851_14580 [Altericroceibacterium spongiae]